MKTYEDPQSQQRERNDLSEAFINKLNEWANKPENSGRMTQAREDQIEREKNVWGRMNWGPYTEWRLVHNRKYRSDLDDPERIQ